MAAATLLIWISSHFFFFSQFSQSCCCCWLTQVSLAATRSISHSYLPLSTSTYTSNNAQCSHIRSSRCLCASPTTAMTKNTHFTHYNTFIDFRHPFFSVRAHNSQLLFQNAACAAPSVVVFVILFIIIIYFSLHACSAFEHTENKCKQNLATD